MSYPAMNQAPQYVFASWLSRVAAILIDGLIGSAIYIVFLIPSILLMVVGVHVYVDEFDEPQFGFENPALFFIGLLLIVVGYLVLLGFVFWNNVYRVSKTGASIGKTTMGIVVVRQDDGQYLSVGMSFLRYLLYAVLGSACFVSYFWPLVDEKNRAWHDMIVETYVVQR